MGRGTIISNKHSQVHINGIDISFSNGKLVIDGLQQGSSGNTGDKTLVSNGIIKGDVQGNVVVKADNVTVNIMGDVQGNIVGAGKVTVKGDIDGNIIGGNIQRM